MIFRPIRLSYFCFSSWNFCISYIILISKVHVSIFLEVNTLEQEKKMFVSRVNMFGMYV